MLQNEGLLPSGSGRVKIKPTYGHTLILSSRLPGLRLMPSVGSYHFALKHDPGQLRETSTAATVIVRPFRRN